MTDTTPADQLRAVLRLLEDAQSYLSVLHGTVGRHDHIGANLACDGCALRDRITPALAVARQLLGTTTAEGATAEPSADRRARYEDALWVHALNVAAAATAVMSVADAEQASLRAEAEGLDEALRGAISASEKDGARLRADLEEFRAIALSRCRTLDEHDAAPPAPADRAAVLTEAADFVRALLVSRPGITTAGVEAELRTTAAEAADDAAAGVQPPTTGEAALRIRVSELAGSWRLGAEEGDLGPGWASAAAALLAVVENPHITHTEVGLDHPATTGRAPAAPAAPEEQAR